MIVRCWRQALLGLAIGFVACRAPESPVVVLDKPEATLSRTFQQVGNVVELSDGRIAFPELSDKTLVFADFTNGVATPIGEHADTIRAHDPAPGKHRMPGFVLRFGGDTLAVVDYATHRTSLWNEQGQFLATLSGQGVGGQNLAVSYDGKHNAYKEDVRSVLGGLEPGQELMFDSMSVIRIRPGDTIADTIAKLKLPPWGRGQFGEQVKMVSTIFAVRDIFGVLPDGSLWIARGSNNAVDWLSPNGKITRGPSRRYTRIPVSEAEKDSFLERLRQQMARMGAPAGIELTYPFADEKAPFVSGMTNPAGEVWLERSRAFGDSTQVWDVVGRDGQLVRTVQFPKAAALAGFGGQGRLYVVLRNGDGRQQIGRYVLQ
jgi:hypothetical protein